MNADDVFRYGHLTVLGCVNGLQDEDWSRPGVCGVWSARDVVAHLASYELATGDVFAGILGEEPGATLDLLLSEGASFNDAQVTERAGQTPAETLNEYIAAYERAAALLQRIPVAQRRENGILPWYGAEYDLEDVIAYMSYGHKREHSAQIAEFCNRLSEAV
jgi:uncharacterized protein (TIGR03083 family)